MFDIALYKPQIPQNTGTLLRLSACLGIKLHIIGPIGFIFDDKKLKRSAMDYFSNANYQFHDNFQSFLNQNCLKRLVALDISNHSVNFSQFKFTKDDILIGGSEHSGFDANDLQKIQNHIQIPMRCGRSLNLAISVSMVVTKASFDIGAF